jgi:hypothetical protein
MQNLGVSTLVEYQNGSNIFLGHGEHPQLPKIQLAGGQNLKRGACLSKKTSGTTVTVAEAVAAAGNTGNGVLTLAETPYATGVKAGEYKIIITEGTVDAVSAVPYSAGPPEAQQIEAVAAKTGAFIVEAPDGKVETLTGKIGTAYNGKIKFTLADGVANFVAGDVFTVTVSISAGDGLYYHWDTQATDGREELVGVLGNDTDATDAPELTMMYRAGDFNKNYLTAVRAIVCGEYKNGLIYIGEDI